MIWPQNVYNIISLSEISLQTRAALSVTENLVLFRPPSGRQFFVSEMMKSDSDHQFDLPIKVNPSHLGRGQSKPFDPCDFNHLATPVSTGFAVRISGHFAGKGL